MLSTIDLVVLACYLAGVVGFGCWFARTSGTTEEFTAAGRSLPGWAVGLSIFGTYVSSISFLANPGKSFAGNWNPFVFGLSLPLAAWIATRWFVPFYRSTGEVSAYQHLERRFGPWARTYAVVCYLLTQLARMGTILYLVALALLPLTGWDVRVTIVVTGVLVTLYTLLGGIEAVIWTDVVQSLVLTVGMLVCVVVLLLHVPGGADEFLVTSWQAGRFSLGSFGGSLTESTFWVVLFYGLFVNLQNFGIDQSYVQRYATAKSEQDATRSVWLGALLYLPISAVLFFVGTALASFYAGEFGTLPQAEAGGVKADAVFPHFIATELPPGVTGLLIAAVCAAAMSSVDSSLNCSATLTRYDLYGRFVNGQPTERQSMRVLYAATLFWGVLGTTAALAMTRVKSALDAWWNLAGIFSGGMLGLFLLGLLARRAGNVAGGVGVVAGVTFIAWASLTKLATDENAWFANRLHGNLTIVLGTTTILLVGFLVSLAVPRGEERPDETERAS